MIRLNLTLQVNVYQEIPSELLAAIALFHLISFVLTLKLRISEMLYLDDHLASHD